MHPPYPGKAVLWVSHHTKGTKAKHTNQPQLTLGYSKEQESMVLVLAFWKRKTGTHQTNQSTKQRKNSTMKECILSFCILVYKPSIFSKMISFLKKKNVEESRNLPRLLAQGVKFTDFFNEKNTQKKLPQVFFTSAPCSCVSLRDFVKLIVGAFFYFFNKNELEKKIRYQLPAWRRWQCKCATAVLNCLPLAKNLYGLLLDKPWKCLF